MNIFWTFNQKGINLTTGSYFLKGGTKMTVATIRKCVVCESVDLTNSPEGLTCGDSLCKSGLADTVLSLQEKADKVEILEQTVRHLEGAERNLREQLKNSVEIARDRLMAGLKTLEVKDG